ncbi:hypothetical protein J6590_012162 [Homalodisca vitripennis]|nr:hypothetical protein J6590_012162 [Homalodisca vitripennis]
MTRYSINSSGWVRRRAVYHGLTLVIVRVTGYCKPSAIHSSTSLILWPSPPRQCLMKNIEAMKGWSSSDYFAPVSANSFTNTSTCSDGQTIMTTIPSI